MIIAINRQPWARNCRVLLNGEDISDVAVLAATVTGLVVCVVMDGDHRVKTDPATLNPIQEVRRGLVEVKPAVHLGPLMVAYIEGLLGLEASLQGDKPEEINGATYQLPDPG